MDWNPSAIFQTLTSSLKSLLVSFLIGSISCTCPAEKPTSSDTLSAVAVRWLKSWQVGCVPLYILLSIGLLRSAACNEKTQDWCDLEKNESLLNSNYSGLFSVVTPHMFQHHFAIYSNIQQSNRSNSLIFWNLNFTKMYLVPFRNLQGDSAAKKLKVKSSSEHYNWLHNNKQSFQTWCAESGFMYI